MSVRNKQNWIKDILSKSGTEITTVNEDKAEGWLTTILICFANFQYIHFLRTKFPKKNSKCLPIENTWCQFINESFA